jgi:imidazolonepropionase-like amidohydrolase
MRHARAVLIASIFVGLILPSTPIGGQAPQILINAKRVYTVGPAGIIENGQVLIEGTKIKAVGTNLSAPGAAVYSADSVIPGLIDTHAHIALRRGGDSGTRTGDRRASSAEHRTLDQFNPTDPALRSIVEGGMTTIVTRGSGGGQIFLSQTLAVKLKKAPLEQMVLKPYADMKMYVRAGVGGSFLTLMGWRSAARAEMIRAQDYMQRWADFEKGATKERPVSDPRLEAYAVLLRRESPIHVHTNYPAEIRMVMDFAREFNLRLSLGHGNYAYRVAGDIKTAGVVPVVGPTYIVQSYDEDRWHNGPAELAAAGVDVALQMDMSAQHNKVFLEVGSLLIRHGMREEDALKALTLNGAKAIMMEERIGSLEPGKDADVVLLDGAPFELQTYVTHTFIDGKLEFALDQKPQTAALTRTPALKPLVARTTPQSSRIAIVNATVMPISSNPIASGTVLVEDGRISAVGPRVPVPAGFDTVDAGGRFVTPGLVAARAYPVFVWVPWWGNTAGTDLSDERTEPITPDADARYNLDPAMPGWKIMRELGLTSYLITPGNANVIGGKGAVIRGIGESFAEMVRDPGAQAMVFALGDTVRQQWGDARFDGGGIVTLMREALDRAKAYRLRGERGPRDPKSEALLPVLDRKLLAIFAADRAADIRAAVKIADDYGLRIAISGGGEALEVADDLKRRDIPVILGLSGSGWTAFEGIRGGPGFDEQRPAKLARAGIKVAMFGPGGHRGNLPIGRIGGEPTLNAAWCFKNGMSEADALKMITLNGAEVIGFGDRLGSLEKGKLADVVIWNGHPLTYRGLPDMVLIDGKVVFQRKTAGASSRTTDQAQPD